MKIALPAKQNIKETSAADPLKFYFLPGARSFYLGRFSDAVRLLGGRFGRLLDVGCGSGIFLTELARHCDHLIACDFHDNMTKPAEMLRAESLQATLVRADARELPYASDSIDALVCMSVLEHLRDPEAAAEEFHRVLRPRGVAVIGVPISNLLTEAMLRVIYLTLNADLDDEHVSTHSDVLNALESNFSMDETLTIPRGFPHAAAMYCTVRFRKR